MNIIILNSEIDNDNRNITEFSNCMVYVSVVMTLYSYGSYQYLYSTHRQSLIIVYENSLQNLKSTEFKCIHAVDSVPYSVPVAI